MQEPARPRGHCNLPMPAYLFHPFGCVPGFPLMAGHKRNMSFMPLPMNPPASLHPASPTTPSGKLPTAELHVSLPHAAPAAPAPVASVVFYGAPV